MEKILKFILENQETALANQKEILKSKQEEVAERKKLDDKDEDTRKFRERLLGGIRNLASGIASPVVDTVKTFWDKLKEAFMLTFGMTAVIAFMEWWEGGGRETIKIVFDKIGEFLYWIGSAFVDVWEGYQEGGIRGALGAVIDNWGAILAGIATFALIFAPGSTLLLAFRGLSLAVRGLFLAGRGLASMGVGMLRGRGRAALVGGLATAAVAATALFAGSADASTDPSVVINQNTTFNPAAIETPTITGSSEISPEGRAHWQALMNEQDALTTDVNGNYVDPATLQGAELDLYNQNQQIIQQYNANYPNQLLPPVADATPSPTASSTIIASLADADSLGETELATTIQTGSNTAMELAQELSHSPDAEKQRSLRALYEALETAIEVQSERTGTDIAVLRTEAGIDAISAIMSTQTRGDS